LSPTPLFLFFPLAVGLWLLVAILSGLLSGWFKLAALYPDRAEEPVLRLRGQSGRMGPGVWFRAVLRLSGCRSGLRVGMNRFMGPFCRDFFVPWESIAVSTRSGPFGTLAELQFGKPAAGRLTISAVSADKLANAAAGRWETGRFPEETGREVRSLFRRWAIISAFCAGLFAAVPLFVSFDTARPPIAVAALLLLIACGLIFVGRILTKSD
jgi:hypothetical protein